MAKASVGKKTIQTWIGLAAIAVILIAFGVMIKQYAPQASSSCNPSKKQACLLVQMTYASGGVVGTSMKQAGVRVSFYNKTVNPPLPYQYATTDSNGLAVMYLDLPKNKTSYDIEINATKTGYTGNIIHQTVQSNKTYNVKYPLSYVQTPSPSPVARISPTPVPTDCTPVATPVSAAQACLTIQVKDSAGQPVSGAIITAPSVITRAETNAQGIAGPFAIRLNGVVNAGVTTYIPRQITVKATLPYDLTSATDSSILQKIVKAITVQAAGYDATGTIDIPTPTNRRLDLFVPSGNGGGDTSACSTESTTLSSAANRINKLFGIEKAEAAAQVSTTKSVCVHVRDTENDGPQSIDGARIDTYKVQFIGGGSEVRSITKVGSVTVGQSKMHRFIIPRPNCTSEAQSDSTMRHYVFVVSKPGFEAVTSTTLSAPLSAGGTTITASGFTTVLCKDFGKYQPDVKFDPTTGESIHPANYDVVRLLMRSVKSASPSPSTN